MMHLSSSYSWSLLTGHTVVTPLDPCEHPLVGTAEQHQMSVGANPAVVPEALYRMEVLQYSY